MKLKTKLILSNLIAFVPLTTASCMFTVNKAIVDANKYAKNNKIIIKDYKTFDADIELVKKDIEDLTIKIDNAHKEAIEKENLEEQSKYFVNKQSQNILELDRKYAELKAYESLNDISKMIRDAKYTSMDDNTFKIDFFLTNLNEFRNKLENCDKEMIDKVADTLMYYFKETPMASTFLTFKDDILKVEKDKIVFKWYSRTYSSIDNIYLKTMLEELDKAETFEEKYFNLLKTCKKFNINIKSDEESRLDDYGMFALFPFLGLLHNKRVDYSSTREIFKNDLVLDQTQDYFWKYIENPYKFLTKDVYEMDEIVSDIYKSKKETRLLNNKVEGALEDMGSSAYETMKMLTTVLYYNGFEDIQSMMAVVPDKNNKFEEVKYYIEVRTGKTGESGEWKILDPIEDLKQINKDSKFSDFQSKLNILDSKPETWKHKNPEEWNKTNAFKNEKYRKIRDLNSIENLGFYAKFK